MENTKNFTEEKVTCQCTCDCCKEESCCVEDNTKCECTDCKCDCNCC